jgi:hypothetical protein
MVHRTRRIGQEGLARYFGVVGGYSDFSQFLFVPGVPMSRALVLFAAFLGPTLSAAGP